MKPVLAWAFPGGKHKQVATSVVLVNNTAKTIDTTVPAGKRWLLQSIAIRNIDDVTRDVSIALYKEVGKTTKICNLLAQAALAAAAAEDAVFPGDFVETANHQFVAQLPRVLSAGNTIEVVWATGGASTGATDADGLVVDYLEIDVP